MKRYIGQGPEQAFILTELGNQPRGIWKLPSFLM